MLLAHKKDFTAMVDISSYLFLYFQSLLSVELILNEVAMMSPQAKYVSKFIEHFCVTTAEYGCFGSQRCDDRNEACQP